MFGQTQWQQKNHSIGRQVFREVYRRNYEMLHKIHSSEYEEELNERKKATINKATKSVNL